MHFICSLLLSSSLHIGSIIKTTSFSSRFSLETSSTKPQLLPSSIRLSKNNNENDSIEKYDEVRRRFAGADDLEIEESTLYHGVADREEHVRLLDQSLQRLTGRGIRDRISNDNSDNDYDTILTNSRYALYSHGVLQSDMIDGAVHNYANFGALASFGVTYKQFLQIPCTRIAPPGFQQGQLDRTLQQLLSAIEAEEGEMEVIEGYSGLRVRFDAQKTIFQIKDVVIWNCYSEKGKYYGQATLFDREKIDYAKA